MREFTAEQDIPEGWRALRRRSYLIPRAELRPVDGDAHIDSRLEQPFVLSARGLAMTAFVAVTWGCSPPDDAVRFEPPAVYARWWSMTEACSGLTGPFEAVRWYRAPATAIQATEGPGTVAYWTSTGNRIVLADKAVESGRIVRHEMLHALRRERGHSRDLFLTRCRGTVRCDEACEAAAGPPPPEATAATRVPLDSLDVSISSFPLQPSATLYGGAFQLIVAASNRAQYPVIVTFRTLAPGFAVRVFPGDYRLIGDQELGDRGLAAFAAGETKRYVFDLQTNGSSSRVAFPPGEYRIVGSLDSLSTAPLSLRIIP